MDSIQIKRGKKSNTPALLIGEMGYCTDTRELYIGTAQGNACVSYNDSAILAKIEVLAARVAALEGVS